MEAPTYFLIKHVFLCLCGDNVVVLDLKQQRYRALGARRTSRLAELVPGWPTPDGGTEQAVADDDAGCRALAQELVRQGILSMDRATGKDAVPACVPKPSAQILPDACMEPARVNARAIVALTLALASAALRNRFCSLERITRGVNRRNRALQAKAQPLRLERARDLARTYTQLRPLFFASRDACLFESLVLLGFLAHYGIHADWIFGVRMKPWLAHCWLQRDGVVLSDTLEHVGFFTPIMVV